jgi:hypothetical protein
LVRFLLLMSEYTFLFSVSGTTSKLSTPETVWYVVLVLCLANNSPRSESSKDNR